MTAQELAERLGDCRKVGKRYLVPCPAHDDQDPSLELADGEKGVVMICRAGCLQDRVVELVCERAGITRSTLFYASQADTNSTQGRGTIVAVYDYHDAHGLLLYQVERYDPKDFRQRRPHPTKLGTHIRNLKGVTPVLYGLPELLDAVKAGRVVYLVEGEKDVETLRAMGLAATCNPMGAGKWRPNYNEWLRGAHVIILPDNDEAGRTHAQQVAHSLYGIASSIKVVLLPHLPEKGDISDWRAAGGTRDVLEGLMAQAAPWSPESSSSQGEPPDSVWQHAISAVDFVKQDEEEHQSLTADLVYPGCITLIAAPRGTGKSIVALILAVAEVTGGKFRDEQLQPVRVLYVDRDNPPRLIRDRLRHIGVQGAANLRLITRLDAPPLTNKEAWLALPWQEYDVVIIDSIGAATEGVSEKEGRETQHFLATLKDLAQRGLAIVALDNTIKAGTTYRGRGEKADAVDVLYEARDITNWTPTQDDWWLDLPEAGDHTWASRASRHHQKTHMRIAFVASKFRLGMDPAPFALEIDFRGDSWTLRDVTDKLVQAGEEARNIDRKAKQDHFREATAALMTTIRGRSQDNPVTKTEAEGLLMNKGLRRSEARNLLEAQNGTHWRLDIWVSKRGQPIIVVPLAPEGENPSGGVKDHPQDTRTNTGDAQLQFLPGASPAYGGNQPTAATHDAMTAAPSISADGPTSGRRESAFSNPNKDALDPSGGISAAEHIFSQEVRTISTSDNGSGGVADGPPAMWRADI